MSGGGGRGAGAPGRRARRGRRGPAGLAAAPPRRDSLAREERTPGSPRRDAGRDPPLDAPRPRRRSGPAGPGRSRARPAGARGRRGASVVSAGAVIFREPAAADAGRSGAAGSAARGAGEREYLLLFYPSGHWDFVKGKVEAGESLRETAVREAREETGIADLEFVDGFEESIRYRFRSEGRTIRKRVVFYLARTGTRDVELSDEHVAYDWLPFDDSLAKATFDNAKSILLRAERLLLRPRGRRGSPAGRARPRRPNAQGRKAARQD